MPLNETTYRRLQQRFPVFTELPDALAARVLAEGEYRSASAGSAVFDEHLPCGGLPLILEGRLRVFQRGSNGREVELYRVRGGESCMLSLSCLLGEVSYTATAVAEGPLEMVRLPPATFAALLDGSPAFRRHMFAAFGARLGALLEVVEAVVFRRLDQRLAARLIARSDDRLEVTHQMLADELGSVREIVSRLLRSFEERGWIELGRERIVIRDRAALAGLAGAG